jgi:hypothetical protein
VAKRDRQKKQKPEAPPGLFDKLLRPWKSQRVTLTQAGKKQAPLRRGKPAKQKAKSAPKERPAHTPRQKQLRELQTLLTIGKRDPERLAAIISRLLHESRQQEESARLRFERLVWEKAESGGKEDEEPDAGREGS